MPGHEYQDRVSLEAARRIAAALPEHPQWIEVARANLARWSGQRQAPWTARSAAEWAEILDRPIAEIAAALTEDSERGRRLRQDSPFTGILTPPEVWELKRRIRAQFAAF